ncbi:hypothetical protein B0H19DRAFT_1269225 [Mycena capillaripes]|nr:hypothetical protein B0H19DRAFT_1269225 [Mycena capillaripes]
MPNENNPTVQGRQIHGSNGQRRAANTATAQKKKSNGGRSKKAADKNAPDGNDEITQLKALVASLQKTIADEAARSSPANQPQEDIVRLEKPKGEAGDAKRGFILRTAMDLEDEPEEFNAIQRSLHTNVARVNLDVAQDFRRQDPAKTAALFKLMRKAHPYLTEKRFPLNWAVAEMLKQYLRNKRRYGVRVGYIPDRKTRKRQGSDGDASAGPNKCRKTTTEPVGHIDDDNADDNDNDNDDDGEVEADDD